MKVQSYILKIALFATGLSGIVAEYVLSTLATYFLGDSVFQWTMIVSVMLFSMGLGSRFSKYVEGDLLKTFIYIEFFLSILTAFSSLSVYAMASKTSFTGPLIYSLSISIGILIGLEIPLVVRLNERFESLKVNIASILQQDYFGSLLGGLFFAYYGLPVLGLTYTPFLLGGINFLVALALFLILRPQLNAKASVSIILLALVVSGSLAGGVTQANEIILFGEQKRYKDKVIYSEQSRYQKIVITEWKGDYWLFLNHHQQISSRDEILYHEPMVHPAMQICPHPASVLILGGGDGCAAREVLKYPEVERITLVDLDPAVTQLAMTHPALVKINQNSLLNQKVEVLNEDGYRFLEETKDHFDVILIDLPDPRTIELCRLYSQEFYTLASRHLRPHGVLVTQAASPYFATQAFLCIGKTMEAAGFTVASLHNQVMTLGEWGWQMGILHGTDSTFKDKLQSLTFPRIPTTWIDQEAMKLMTSFGKKSFFLDSKDTIKVNRIHDPVLFKYYLKGVWDLY